MNNLWTLIIREASSPRSILFLTLNAPIAKKVVGAVCAESTMFASILNSSVMLGNYLQQKTSADYIFRCFFFLALQGLIWYSGVAVMCWINLLPSLPTRETCRRFDPLSFYSWMRSLSPWTKLLINKHSDNFTLLSVALLKLSKNDFCRVCGTKPIFSILTTRKSIQYKTSPIKHW